MIGIRFWFVVFGEHQALWVRGKGKGKGKLTSTALEIGQLLAGKEERNCNDSGEGSHL